MLSINMDDVYKVLSSVKYHLIALAVVIVLGIAIMVAVRKLPKSKKFLARGETAMAMILAVAVIVNLICTGPMLTMISLATGGGTISEETSAEASALVEDIAEEGIVLLEEENSLSPQELSQAKELLAALGVVETVPSAQMGIAGTVAGCGPAYAALFLEALGDAGVYHGLPRELSYRLAAQMLAGTGKLHLATGQHPGAMKDAVCSPGGTTIRGVAQLEQHGFRAAVIDAVSASVGEKKE